MYIFLQKIKKNSTKVHVLQNKFPKTVSEYRFSFILFSPCNSRNNLFKKKIYSLVSGLFLHDRKVLPPLLFDTLYFRQMTRQRNSGAIQWVRRRVIFEMYGLKENPRTLLSFALTSVFICLYIVSYGSNTEILWPCCFK